MVANEVRVNVPLREDFVCGELSDFISFDLRVTNQ